jgi:glycosyltransferase involved in cell wall biosynthesis
MRVLIISGSGLPIRCGIAHDTDHLMRQLERQGVDVRLVTHVDATGSDTVRNVVERWSPGCLPRLVSEIRAFAPHVLHFVYPSVMFPRSPFVNLLPHLLKWRFPKLPLVVTLHEYHDASVPGRIRCAVTATAADLLLVTNEEDHARLRRLPIRRLATVPLGNHFPVETPSPSRAAALRHAYGISDDELVGFVGFIDADKGIECALRALALLQDKPALLLLSEERPEDALHRHLRQLAAQLDVTLHWPGHLPQQEVSLLMQECRLMVFPFRQPVTARRSTFIASLLHGRPTIATGTSTGPFVNELNCLLLPEMTPRTLAAGIDRLRHDPELCQNLASEARQLAGVFDWQRVGATVVALYDEVLAP